MASDRGSQIVTIRFHRPVDSDVVNKRFQDIRMLGIYKGGRMSWAAGTVTLSPLVCEISDGTHQVRVETIGSVSQALPDNQYLVLRWVYTGAENTDFMEIVSVATTETNDVVVGKVESGQVIYTERTTPDTHHLFLRVEEMETPSSSVRVRAGIGHTGSAHSPIIDQILDLSAYSSGNIVYIYVTDTGGLGRSATAATYAGKALLAKIVYPGDGIIENSDIEDVRSFITPPAIPDESSITRSSTGKLEVKDLGITKDKINSNVADEVTIEKDGSTGRLKVVSPGGDYIKVSDQVANGVGAQANASNAWTKKRINTENNDTGGHCSIANNQITLAAGTYRCHITSPVYRNCRQHKARLRNITNNTTTLVGTSELQHDDYSRETQRSIIVGQFTIATTKIFEIQHYKKGGSGWGTPASVGEVEVYTVAEFWKVG